MIPRLLQALIDLGVIGERPYSESCTVTITNHHHITVGIRSDKALTVITEALEAAASTANQSE